nr:hypothetical protein [Tanacetum cinerariifolium]
MNDNQTRQFRNQETGNVAGQFRNQNDQNAKECDDERVVLANLIANLKLDIDENKNIQKKLKKANTTLAQELTECKSILAETSRTLEESNSIRDRIEVFTVCNYGAKVNEIVTGQINQEEHISNNGNKAMKR